jgi:aminoglycoside phosphotransferase (APT) family kinase protein
LIFDSIRLQPVVEQFQIDGAFLEAIPHGSGHINETYLVHVQHNGDRIDYILQQINQYVFKHPVWISENIRNITDHMQNRKQDLDGIVTREVLQTVPARDGRDYHIDKNGTFWRVFAYISDATSFDVIENTEQAYQAARGFGEFQYLLCDFPADQLHEIIPDFHHTPRRVEAFERALDADSHNRAAGAKHAIKQALRFKEFSSRIVDDLASGAIPMHSTHNDTKLNNVMLCKKTGMPVCVIDLDTVMPGSSLYDFGDMMRTATCFASEDERNLDKIQVQMPIFDAITRGYLSIAHEFLVDREIELLAFSGQLITYEIGVRFLTDHLEGDPYFKIHRDCHNLDRARAQFKLVESFAAQEEAMQRIVDQTLSAV